MPIRDCPDEPAPLPRHDRRDGRADIGRRHRAAVSQPRRRPAADHARDSVGRLSLNSGVVWARADRPARMLVEVATTDSFKAIRRAVFVDALPESDFTAKALIDGLPAGQDIFYRVRFQDLGRADHRRASRRSAASAPRRPSGARSRFVWSGDTAGQGWGINESRGGMKIYETMREQRPDFFIHSGDTIYADGPIEAEKSSCPTAALWKNLVHRGEAEGRRDARRVPRQLQLQPARRERARASTPKCRCSRSGTITRSPTTGPRRSR